MNHRIRHLFVVAALVASLTPYSVPAAPPNNKGSGGFRGGGSGGGGGASGQSGPKSGSQFNAGTNKNFTAGKPGGTGGGGSGSGSQVTTFSHKSNNTIDHSGNVNHTPTFTQPAHVTRQPLSISNQPVHNAIPPNKITTGGSNTNLSSGVHVTNPSLGKHIQSHQNGVNANQLHKFPSHTVQGNQLLIHNQGQVHALNAHVYNHAYIGNQAIHLAGAGYHPSYYAHSWYHSPWSGNAWGWGWGLGPGFGFGLGGLGWGIGIGSGWGYGGFGYGGFGGYGPYGPYGPYGYWGRPLGWGFGGWGLGLMAYDSGYYPYYNPYWYPPVTQTVVYNYSTPIPVATNVGADPNLAATNNSGPPPSPQSENPAFDAARAAFRAGDYRAALASVDTAIAKTPTDSVFHEFRALTLFALQDYKQAAGVIHSLLAVGPGWDWTTMSGLYADPDAYTQQLRALEQFTRANPKAADAHFLLAYHYTTTGHSEAAATQLQQVVKLMPTDKLAGELLRMVQGPPKQETPATPPDPAVAEAPATPADGGPQPDPIDKDLLPGSWSASRPDGSSFSLNLTDDGKFTWKFALPKQKGDEFGGTYSIDGPVLILQREGGGGGALAGTATFDGDDKFNFRMVGAPPEDKGLDFGKS